MPQINQGLVFLGACLIAGLRLAREKQVHTGVIPTSQAIDESINVSYEIFVRVFRKVGREIQER